MTTDHNHPVRMVHADHDFYSGKPLHDILAISVPFEERHKQHPYKYVYEYVDSRGVHMALCERTVDPTPGKCSGFCSGAPVNDR